MHQKRLRKLKLSELTMNIWTDCGLFLLYIYIHEQFSLACLIPTPMFSLFSWFSIAALAPRVLRAWNLMTTPVRNGRRFFVLSRKKCYFVEKWYAFLLITFSETFSNFKSNRLINATVCETPMLKKYFNSWKRYFLVWQFRENQIFIISALF